LQENPVEFQLLHTKKIPLTRGRFSPGSYLPYRTGMISGSEQKTVFMQPEVRWTSACRTGSGDREN